MIYTHLENGIEVAIKRNEFSPAVAIQCWVGVGSKDESEHQRGMAHFIEHMLFKGTNKRAVGQIAAEVEMCGGDINAYTSFDRTVFYLTMGKQHGEIGVDLLSDAIFNSTFDVEEFAREKEVILEEIRRGLDNPGQIIGRKVFEICYEGTEIGRPIIGYSEQVGGYTRDELVSFYKEWYQPQNMTVVIVGDVEESQCLEWVKTGFGNAASKPVPEKVLIDRPVLTSTQASVVKGDFEQPRIEVVYPAPGFEDQDSAVLDLYSYALGTGDLSRLNVRLRDKAEVLTAVGVSHFSPSFGGVFEVSAVVEEAKLLAAVSGIAEQIQLIATSDPLTDTEIRRAQVNIRTDRVFRDETVDGQARSLGQGLLTRDKLLSEELYLTKIDKLDRDIINGGGARWFDPEKAVVVALVPESSTLDESQILDAFAKGLKRVAVKPVPVAARVANSDNSAAEIVEIKPGIKLVYRRNSNSEIFSLTAVTEGGQRAEAASTAGFYNFMSGLMATSSQTTEYEQFLGGMEDLGGSLDGFSGKDSFGFSLQCLSDKIDPMLRYFKEGLLEPKFETHLWQTIQKEIAATMLAQRDSPASLAIRKFQEELFGEHPYRYPSYGTEESIGSADESKLLEFYSKNRDQGPWVLAAVGPMDVDDVVDRFTSGLEGFQPNQTKRAFDSANLTKSGVDEGSFHIEKQREQTHIVLGYRGMTWFDPNRAASDVMINILGGHGGRLFMNLRDRMSLAYSVSPIVTYGCHPGLVGSYIACAPDKTEQATKALQKEMHGLVEELVSEEEMQRACNYIIGNHEMGMQRSDAQSSTMALMELYGIGFDDFIRYSESIRAVTREDIQRVAEQVFKGPGVSVTVGPNV